LLLSHALSISRQLVTMHGLCAVCYASQGSPEAELTLVFLIEKALGHNSASHTQGPSPASIALLCLSNVNTAQSVGSLCHEHRPDAVLCCAVLCYAVDAADVRLLTRGRQVEGQSRRQEEAAAAQGQEEGQQERRLCRRWRRWRARSSSLCAE
jgi:hypothetical protein